jgi:hypothetical protein
MNDLGLVAVAIGVSGFDCMYGKDLDEESWRLKRNLTDY